LRLSDWLDDNPVKPEMYWKGAAEHQFAYLRLIHRRLRLKDPGTTATVVSHHTSKSIKLPVVEFDMPEYKLKLTCRDNFYNWGFTLESEVPLGEFNHDGFQFDENPIYYEGFTKGYDEVIVPVYTHTPVPNEHSKFSFKLHQLEPLEILPRLFRAVREGQSYQEREAAHG